MFFEKIKKAGFTLTISEAIEEVHPKACLMEGIAYGANKDRQKIGDVLISKAFNRMIQ